MLLLATVWLQTNSKNDNISIKPLIIVNMPLSSDWKLTNNISIKCVNVINVNLTLSFAHLFHDIHIIKHLFDRRMVLCVTLWVSFSKYDMNFVHSFNLKNIRICLILLYLLRLMRKTIQIANGNDNELLP